MQRTASIYFLKAKQAFQQLARDGLVRLVTRKPLRPTAEECERNRRCRSARMRVMERVNVFGPRPDLDDRTAGR